MKEESSLHEVTPGVFQPVFSGPRAFEPTFGYGGGGAFDGPVRLEERSADAALVSESYGFGAHADVATAWNIFPEHDYNNDLVGGGGVSAAFANDASAEVYPADLGLSAENLLNTMTPPPSPSADERLLPRLPPRAVLKEDLPPQLPALQPASPSSLSTATSHAGSSPASATSEPGGVNRPELTEDMLVELTNIAEFRKNDRYAKYIVDYHDNISFPLGEGGRELLRACLNVRGCKGRQLQGASVPVLLQLAHQWNLWDVAIRIKVERQTGQLSPAHEAFVRFKATQSQLRKYVRKEYMVTERDPTGKISRILYDENRKIKLGKDGREALRAKLRRLHDKHASRMDELLAQHGFKYSELRNATVQQLSRMAFVCNLWDQVVSACRSQEEKRDGRGKVKSPTSAAAARDEYLEGSNSSSVVDSSGGLDAGAPGTHQVKLPFNLLNGEMITTDENGEMSNVDARRTMEAVSQLLQQNFSNPDLFNAAAFAEAFSATADASPLRSPAHAAAATPFRDVKREPCDEPDLVVPDYVDFNAAGFF